MTVKNERRAMWVGLIAAVLGIAVALWFLGSLLIEKHPNIPSGQSTSQPEDRIMTDPTGPIVLTAPVQGPGVQEYLTTLRESQGSVLDGVSDTELVGFADRFCAAAHNENGTERAVTALVTALPTYGRQASLATPIAQTASAHMCPEYLTEVQTYLESQGVH